MSDNVKNYSKICSKIGFAMLLFYAFFTLSAFAVAIISTISEILMGTFEAEVMYEILAAIAYFFSFSGAAFILRAMTKKYPSSRPIYTSFRFNKWTALLIIAIVAVNFTLAYVNTVMITSLAPDFAAELASSTSSMEGRPISEVIVFFILSIISTAIVPAICEEYLFRGAVLTNLMPYGKTTAIVASSFLFGLMHQNPLQLLYTTLMGVVIGYVYVKTKSIWVCIIIHFVNNFVTVVEEYLPILTRVTWISGLIDLLIMLSGAVALILIIFKKDSESGVEQNGSFGVIYESGMDFEEYELALPRGEKLKRFFSVTVVIYTVICMFSIVSTFLSFFGVGFSLL